MLDFIHPIAQEKLHQQVQHLAPCRHLDLAFGSKYLLVEQECEKAISQIDIKLTSVAYSFMMEISDTVIKKLREALVRRIIRRNIKLFESYLMRSTVLTDP